MLVSKLKSTVFAVQSRMVGGGRKRHMVFILAKLASLCLLGVPLFGVSWQGLARLLMLSSEHLLELRLAAFRSWSREEDPGRGAQERSLLEKPGAKSSGALVRAQEPREGELHKRSQRTRDRTKEGAWFCHPGWGCQSN